MIDAVLATIHLGWAGALGAFAARGHWGLFVWTIAVWTISYWTGRRWSQK